VNFTPAGRLPNIAQVTVIKAFIFKTKVWAQDSDKGRALRRIAAWFEEC
jgi:hypothetical protein